MKKPSHLKILGVATVASALFSRSAEAIVAQMGGQGLTMVSAIQNFSGAIQAVALPATAIGITCGAVSLYRARNDWSNIGHGAMEWAAIGGIALGVPSFVTLIPGVQGALL